MERIEHALISLLYMVAYIPDYFLAGSIDFPLDLAIVAKDPARRDGSKPGASQVLYASHKQA